jgi:hypothetical protein
LQDFNQQILKIQAAGFSTAEKFDWTQIPAMCNSVTMMKLLLISRSGLQRLIDDLEEKGFTSKGWIINSSRSYNLPP